MMEPEKTVIQKLIALKRYEQPPEGFVDDFLINFHHRQRSELLRQSSFGLFWDRLTAYMTGRSTQVAGFGFATALVLAIGASMVWSPSRYDGGKSFNVAKAESSAPVDSLQGPGDFIGIPSLGFEEDKASKLSPERLAAAFAPHSPSAAEPNPALLEADVNYGLSQPVGAVNQQQNGRKEFIQNASSEQISPLINPQLDFLFQLYQSSKHYK